MLKLACDCPSCRARVRRDFDRIVSANYSRGELLTLDDLIVGAGLGPFEHDHHEDTSCHREVDSD